MSDDDALYEAWQDKPLVGHIVQIYCDDPSHPTRRALIARLSVHELWLKDEASGRRKSREVLLREWDEYKRENGPETVAMPTIAYAKPIDPEVWQVIDRDAAEPTRIRWRLSCPLCRMTVPARGERLKPLLLKMRDHGVAELSLRGLATILV